jgi:hypothetical protein
MRRYMSGVADYDWSKWDAKAGALTEAEKTEAAAIADTFQTAADFQRWMDTDTKASLRMRFVVQYAATAKKAPVKDLAVTSMFNSGWEKETPMTAAATTETPWLLYAAGAAALFLLLRK